LIFQSNNKQKQLLANLAMPLAYSSIYADWFSPDPVCTWKPGAEQNICSGILKNCAHCWRKNV